MLFLCSINFFYRNQYGFRFGPSTEVALINFMTTYTAVNNGSRYAALFIGIAKAFVTVDRAIFLDKLWEAGFRRIAYEWLISYLLNRKQVVYRPIGSSTN